MTIIKLMDMRVTARIPLLTALAIAPVTAQAAEASFLYQTYSSGLTSLVLAGLALSGMGRVLGGNALGHILSQRLSRQGYDNDKFDKTRSLTRHVLPLVIGTVIATAFATNLYARGQNFEMATLSALTGSAVLAGEALYFLGHTAVAYFTSRRQLTTDAERNEAFSKYQPLVRDRVAVLENKLSELRNQKIVYQKQIEEIEAEKEYLKYCLDDLKTAKYERMFASYRGVLARYFDNLSNVQPVSQTGAKSFQRSIQPLRKEKQS